MKKIFKIIIILIIILLSYFFLNKYFNKEDNITLKVMKENNIDKSIYSKTLEYVLLNGIYDEKYLNEYKDIIFNDNDNFENIITTFLPKGYTGKEINYIIKPKITQDERKS